MSTQTVHFRVGADFGITLMQIANEHLLYTNDLDKALNVYTESLGGEVPEELALKLLSGEMLLLVDEEDQMFNVVERAKYMHLDKIYPAQIDFDEFVVKMQKELDDHVDTLDKSLDYILNEFRYKKEYAFTVPIKSVIKYIYGKDEEMIEDVLDVLEYDDDIQIMRSIMRSTKDFIEKSFKLSEMIKRLEGMYPIQASFDTYELTNLVSKVQEIANGNFTMFVEASDDILTSYMDASKEIDEVLSTGIKPVDIMDSYNAGWLSPEGEYYALNGEIANMLHTQIAEALQEQGIVPKWDDINTEEFGNPLNADSWLEQQGWVKIHDNNVQFGGNLNDKLGEENVYMTDTQKKIVYEYISNCHQSLILLGWKRERFSAGQFMVMDKIALHKHFEF